MSSEIFIECQQKPIQYIAVTVNDAEKTDVDIETVASRPTVSAVVQLVECRTRNREVVGSTHTRSTASNLEQVANLLCAQANSAFYPQRDGK